MSQPAPETHTHKRTRAHLLRAVTDLATTRPLMLHKTPRTQACNLKEASVSVKFQECLRGDTSGHERERQNSSAVGDAFVYNSLPHPSSGGTVGHDSKSLPHSSRVPESTPSSDWVP